MYRKIWVRFCFWRLEIWTDCGDTFIIVPFPFESKFLLIVSMVEKPYNELRGGLLKSVSVVGRIRLRITTVVSTLGLVLAKHADLKKDSILLS